MAKLDKHGEPKSNIPGLTLLGIMIVLFLALFSSSGGCG